jgi:hypothetical protein
LQKTPLKKSRSKRKNAAESTRDSLSNDNIDSRNRNFEKKVLPANATKKVWDKEVDNDYKNSL